MEPLLSRLIIQAAPRARIAIARVATTPWYGRVPSQRLHASRGISTTRYRSIQERKPVFDTQTASDSAHSQPAADLSQDVGKAENDHFSRVEQESKKMQTRSPWMREGSDVPPVARYRSAGAMVKGKLLTTPSRMLKLILPLTTRDANRDRKDIMPLALLVHPQQPLSYLERLIQSELPLLQDEKKDKERPPNINFRAQDNTEEQIGKTTEADEDEDPDDSSDQLQDAEETKFDGKTERTGKIGGGEKKLETLPSTSDRLPTGEANEEDTEHPNFVRWSPSTEIGDFIRDAARGKEFAVDIEGAPEPIYVGVPSFADRTYYLRMRMRKVAKRISSMADIKKECDHLARRGAKRVAQGGFAGLIGWWGLVYYLTFRTELGWDVMEPVTYLVGLSGLIGGYLWFLYHNREVSYASALHVTVSRRQSQLYELKGFNLPQWETSIEEGNRLRREIKLIAEEYDVDWDETKDEGDEKVRQALRKERKKKEGDKDKKDKDGEEEEDED